jgi:hypothetical protein
MKHESSPHRDGPFGLADASLRLSHFPHRQVSFMRNDLRTDAEYSDLGIASAGILPAASISILNFWEGCHERA